MSALSLNSESERSPGHGDAGRQRLRDYFLLSTVVLASVTMEGVSRAPQTYLLRQVPLQFHLAVGSVSTELSGAHAQSKEIQFLQRNPSAHRTKRFRLKEPFKDYKYLSPNRYLGLILFNSFSKGCPSASISHTFSFQTRQASSLETESLLVA